LSDRFINHGLIGCLHMRIVGRMWHFIESLRDAFRAVNVDGRMHARRLIREPDPLHIFASGLMRSSVRARDEVLALDG
jgi:hypothetical protein